MLAGNAQRERVARPRVQIEHAVLDVRRVELIARLVFLLGPTPAENSVPPTGVGGPTARASVGCETSRASTVKVGAAASRQRMHGPASEASKRSRSA